MWFCALLLVALELALRMMGCHSWVQQNGGGAYIIDFRDRYAKANSYIPFEHVSHVELCRYTFLEKDTEPSVYGEHVFDIMFR